LQLHYSGSHLSIHHRPLHAGEPISILEQKWVTRIAREKARDRVMTLVK